MSLPLQGIRILDLTRAYAGTIGTQYLADLGADVIKIEAVSRPDIPTREMNLAELDPGEKTWERAAYFHRLNIGKRDITLDLSSEQGRDMFRRLVPQADVVAENYNPQTMRKFGLHYEALKELNPKIIMCSMSGFGGVGPRSNWSAYAGPMETMAGLTSVCGYDAGQTVGSATALGDWSLGTMGAISILSALHYRNRTGKGQYIDVAGRDAVAAALGEAMLDITINDRVLKPQESRHPTMAPHDTFACEEENTWVAIAIR
ncbi:MAG: CoA transferase, partial [Gammaproteobacteria bacterium]|nr:CoA transferase [Gammaproteobacteria bacterium]